MQLCRVTGNAVATVKAPALQVVERQCGTRESGRVAQGTAARELEATAGAPTDATVVAILDPQH